MGTGDKNPWSDMLEAHMDDNYIRFISMYIKNYNRCCSNLKNQSRCNGSSFVDNFIELATFLYFFIVIEVSIGSDTEGQVAFLPENPAVLPSKYALANAATHRPGHHAYCSNLPPKAPSKVPCCY